MTTGEIKLISASAASVHGNGNSFHSAISDDGDKVAFRSDSNNIIGGYSGNQVYVKDTSDNTVAIASATAADVQQNNVAYYPEMSSDGRYVFFTTRATNLPNGPTASR